MINEVFRVPLEAFPQTFRVTLSGIEVEISTSWNDAMNLWVMSMKDYVADKMLIGAIALVPGVDLLEQYEYLGFGARMVVYNNQNPAKIPDLDDLGGATNLYYLTVS